ncbi:hypothetical protein CPT_Moby_078 [Stenotrophomonas phage Moby]|uniref:Uncharacterized protein n=1 Tax=Stenotrophomonas phage Moby TaxID=2601680 RepID=A0A5P8PM52_9CAUD|nr:hypothetical protein HWC58_gp078 [Stenotrophomonas phage Moby]QFR57826.1 hypothetical protein CPT_Moby_078 [Stenotrophomonas phage Moby]
MYGGSPARGQSERIGRCRFLRPAMNSTLKIVCSLSVGLRTFFWL